MKRKYDYLVSFHYNGGYGNAIISVPKKISSTDDFLKMQDKLKHNRTDVKNLSISSYQLIGTRKIKAAI